MTERNSSEQVEKKVTLPAPHKGDPDAMMHEVLKAWKEQQEGTKPGHAIAIGGLKGAAGAITCAEIIGKTGPGKIDMCAEKIDWKDGPGKGSKVDLCAEKIEWKDGPGKGSKVDTCAEIIQLPKEGKDPQGKDACAALVEWPNQLKPHQPDDGGLHKIGDGSGSTVNTCAAIIKLGKPEPSKVDTCAAVIKLGKPEPSKVDTCAAIIKNFPGTDK
jgi:hypothetical protein